MMTEGCNCSEREIMKKRVGFAFVAMVIFYVAILGRTGLLEPDEGRYAEIAREMKESGDLLIPTLNGVPHFQKPPVIYWSTAACMVIFGENELGARMAPLLAAFGVLLLTYYIGCKLLSPRTARTAVWLLAGGLQFFVLSRGLCPDMVMTFWITASITGFVWARTNRNPSKWRYIPFFVCMGLAFATKGPMGIVVPLMTAIGWQLAARKYDSSVARIPWALGMGLTMMLAIGWFLLCIARFPELGRYFVEYELISRFFGHVQGRSEPFWFFVPVLLVGWLPWSPLLGQVIRARQPWGDDSSLRHVVPWAILGWVIVPLILLSFSGSKLMTYVLPLFPGISLWFAHGLMSSHQSKVSRMAFTIQLLVLLALCGAVMAIVFFPGVTPSLVAFDPWFLPLLLCLCVLCAFACSRLLRGITETRVANIALLSIAIWSALNSQLGNVGPLLARGASLRPLAE